MCLQKPKRISMRFSFVFVFLVVFFWWGGTGSCISQMISVLWSSKVWNQLSVQMDLKEKHLSSDLKVQSCVEAMEKTFPSKL